jgi:hypothetical protein
VINEAQKVLIEAEACSYATPSLEIEIGITRGYIEKLI